MTDSAPPARDRLGAWCGWVWIGTAVLTPLLAWLGPLGFAPLLALVGLLCLPAIRLEEGYRPVLVVLLLALVWAAVSTIWSPHVPDSPEESIALKLGLALPLYWAAICGARRAKPKLRRIALAVFAWGMAGLGLLLLAEAATGGRIYLTLHEAFYEPIRPDLAGKNLGQATFVMALLWPLAWAGGLRARVPWWSAIPMALGTAVAAVVFDADAPAMAVALAVLAGLATWRWSASTPKALGSAAAVLFIVMPALVLATEMLSEALHYNAHLPLSWAMRVSYWRHAVDWISDHPLRGLGLDASRELGPGIQLHPHNDPLQLWLELGAIGALLAAAFWWLALSRLSRPKSDLAASATAASAAVYLLFACVNFGVWQEWWVALGALVAALGTLQRGQNVLPPSTSRPI